MKHLRHLEEAQLKQPGLVTIGMFDGVHRGHQALIQQLVATADKNGCQSVVLTFYPHPDVVLQDLQGRYYLTTVQQRAELLGAMGVDYVITHPFDASVRETRADEFVDKLVTHLNMNALWVGADFALGYRREGTVDYLSELGETRDYTVRPIDLVAYEDDGKPITSTRIRRYLTDGNIEQANRLLGRRYAVRGEVIEGDKRGRTIGFPTANMAVPTDIILPDNGVYAGWVTVAGVRHMAVANIGVRPTFAGKTLTVEPYILDFDRMIYGETIAFAFEKRLRGEKKFDGLDALRAQLQQDIAAGRAHLSAQNPAD
jgi:riboflavin kinase/FMN adenylyltransferase